MWNAYSVQYTLIVRTEVVTCKPYDLWKEKPYDLWNEKTWEEPTC